MALERPTHHQLLRHTGQLEEDDEDEKREYMKLIPLSGPRDIAVVIAGYRFEIKVVVRGEESPPGHLWAEV